MTKRKQTPADCRRMELLLLAMFLAEEDMAVSSYETCTYPRGVFNDQIWRDDDPEGFALARQARRLLRLKPFRHQPEFRESIVGQPELSRMGERARHGQGAMMTAARSEPARAAAVEAIARRKWDEMQATFPRFTRQRWEDGTEAARQEVLRHAEREYVTTYHREKARQ